MRLTPEVIRNASVSLNPLKERELGLRSLSIVMVENLGVTEDIYDAIDFTDNQIFAFENFPMLQRLKTLLLSKNRITSISSTIGKNLPHLQSLSLADNNLSRAQDLLPLSDFHSLTTLILAGNPVVELYKNYRIVVIALVPSLTSLDSSSIRDDERQLARRLRSKLDAGTPIDQLAILSPQKYRNTAELANPLPTSPSEAALPSSAPLLPTLTDEVRQQLMTMIDNAESLEEIDEIERILATGSLPADFIIKT